MFPLVKIDRQSNFPSVATTTLAGNSGNNILNAPGLESTLVQGFQGEDTITLSLVNDEAAAGQGNDTVYLTSTGTHKNIVSGGAGSDTIRFAAATVNSQSVAGGAGDDLIAIDGTGIVSELQIAGNEGNDTVTLAGTTIVNSYIGLGQGNDSVAFASSTSFAAGDLFGGKGKDTLALGNLTGASSTINGGNGADLITTGASTLTSAKIGAGKGTDSINIGTGVITGSIAGGGLADTITIGTGSQAKAITIFGDANGVTTKGTGTEGGADGADVIGATTAVAGAATVYGAGGADTIKVLSGTSAGILDGGNGSDSIYLAGAGALQSVNGGAGTDNITVATAMAAKSAIASVNGGSGNDTLTFAGEADATFTTAAAAGSASSTTALNMAVYGAASGDVIKLTNTTMTNSTAGTTNWLINGAATVFVYSAAGQLSAGIGAGTGDIGVYSDGTNTIFSIGDNSNGVQKIYVDGLDLVTTTVVGSEQTLNSSNFGFTLAQDNTTSNYGVVITLS